MTEVVQPLVVRFGLRGIGALGLAFFGGTGILMTASSLLLLSEGESVLGVTLGLAMGAVFIAVAGAALTVMCSRRVVAILSPDGVEFPWVAVPSVRTWAWSEIDSVEATQMSHQGSRTDYLFGLVPSARARRLRSAPDDLTRVQRYLVRPAGPGMFSIWWFTTPAPRVVNKYIYAVAPDLGLPLIPPRRRPKRYPWSAEIMTGMITLRDATDADHSVLVQVWRSSVDATHDFLADADRDAIEARLASDYFPQVRLTVAEVDGAVAGFSGVAGEDLAMLFVRADARGAGVGRALLRHAIRERGVRTVDVNEQNDQAVGFYAHSGFTVTGRSETDGDGLPYPLLHLALGSA